MGEVEEAGRVTKVIGDEWELSWASREAWLEDLLPKSTIRDVAG